MTGVRSRRHDRQVPGLLCTTMGVTPAVVALRPPREELPSLARSYEPMRQTKTLVTASVYPVPSRPCRLSPISAGRWSFPMLLPVLLTKWPGPLSRGSLLVHALVSSQEASVSPKWTRARRARLSPRCNFNGALFAGLQSFTNVQAPWIARPPGCTHRAVFRRRAAGPFTPRRTWPVTRIRLWHRYMSEPSK